jgi:4-amino-4-deoxy-L-arabinose transferase-like glycosyltransferase
VLRSSRGKVALIARPRHAAPGCAVTSTTLTDDAQVSTAGRLRARLRVRAYALWITLAAAVAAGAALRLPALSRVPPGLNQDEAVNAYDGYSLFLTGRDHLGHPFPLFGLEAFGDWRSPLLAYVLAPFTGIFGPHVEVVRAVTAVAGILAIPVVYLLARELFDDTRVAAVAAGAIAVSPALVTLSRFAIEVALLPLVLPATLFVLLWSVRRASGPGIVVAAVGACLTVACYQSMKLYVPVLGVAAAILFLPHLMRIGRAALAAAACILLAGIGPVLYLQLRDPAGHARFDQTSVFHAPGAGPVLLVRQYLRYFDPRFLWVRGDGAIEHGVPGYGLELKVLAPFVVLGVLWMLSQLRPANPDAWRRRCAAFVLVALLVYPLPGTVTVPSPHTLRAVHAVPLLAIAGGAGFAAAIDLVRTALRSAPRALTTGGVAALVAAVLMLGGWEMTLHERTYFGSYRAQAAPAFQYGIADALSYARAHQGAYDEIWITDVAEPYIYVLFYGQVPPGEVHDTLVVHRAPPASNQVTEFGKYRFESLPPGIDPARLSLLESVRGPGGVLAYRIRGGSAPDGKRVLLISKR